MRFTEIDLFGVYVAPISLLMVAAWFIAVGLRQAWYMNRDPGRPVFYGPFRVNAQA